MEQQQQTYTIRALTADDHALITQFITEHWGTPIVVGHGVVYLVSTLLGFVATLHDEIIGLITYQIQNDACEIVTINSLKAGQGIGSMLIEHVKKVAQQAGCKRLWLVTTNDNLHALGFYQKRGFALVALHRNALAVSRRLKPDIPLIGNHGIPLRDEIELEITLGANKT